MKETISQKLDEIRTNHPQCIITVAYNEAIIFPKKADAAQFYLTGMMCCEGSERDRYTNIYTKIMAGYKEANDSANWNLPQLNYVDDITIKGNLI